MSARKFVNTAKKIVKTVVNTAKKAAKTIVNTVKGVAKTAKNAAKHAKQTYQSVKNRVTSSSTYQKITSRGSQFIQFCKQWGTENWKNLYIFQILCFRKNGRNPLRSGTTYVYDNKSYYR